MTSVVLLFSALCLVVVHCGVFNYTCVSSDGLPMQAGHGYVPSRCIYCTCQSSGEVTCETIQCNELNQRCEKFEMPPGGCCPLCVDDGPLIII